MRNTQEILFGVTSQTLKFDAPEGVPSSVTSSEVFENSTGDDGTAETALSGSAAITGSPDTTIDAASGDDKADPTLLNVAATTGFAIGGVYLVASASLEQEWFECIEITSGASVRARHPFRNAYSSSDTVKSTEVTHAIDSTWVADANNISASLDPNPRYRWRVVYVVGGLTYAHAFWFDLVRYRGEHNVTHLDVDAAWPGWTRHLVAEHREDSGARLIKEAYRDVKVHLHRAELADQMAMNGEIIDDLVVFKAAVIGERSKIVQGTPDPEALALATEIYDSRFNDLIRVKPKIPFATDSTAAARTVQGRRGISQR